MIKIAVVTGASSGLGREFARQIPHLYKQLDEVWVVARRTQRLEELREELSFPVRIFDGDLGRDYIYERIAKELDRREADIRMLVNAAGCGRIGYFHELDIEGQLGMVDMNCRALTKMTCLCMPYLSRGSRIVNVASAAAFGPQPRFAVYAATKSYVYSLSMALGRELKKSGIYVTAVCPGPVDTEFFDHTGETASSVKENFRAEAQAVVRQALIDASKGRKVSVYGTAMKAARIACKVLPYSVIAAVMETANEMES